MAVRVRGRQQSAFYTGEVGAQASFEEHAGPEYSRLTYEEHSRCGRGLFRIAKEGLPANEHWKAAERIVKEMGCAARVL